MEPVIGETKRRMRLQKTYLTNWYIIEIDIIEVVQDSIEGIYVFANYDARIYTYTFTRIHIFTYASFKERNDDYKLLNKNMHYIGHRT